MEKTVIYYPCDLSLLQDKIRRLFIKLGNPNICYISNDTLEYDFHISFHAFRSSVNNFNYRDYFDIDLCAKYYTIQYLLNPDFYSILNKVIGDD